MGIEDFLLYKHRLKKKYTLKAFRVLFLIILWPIGLTLLIIKGISYLKRSKK